MLLALVLSFFSYWIFYTTWKKNIISFKPRKREIHKKPIPRIGGLAYADLVFGCFFGGLSIVKPEFRLSDGLWLGVDKQILAIWIASILISGSMLIDDIRGLKAWQKFFFQILVGLLIIAFGIGIDTLANPFGERR